MIVFGYVKSYMYAGDGTLMVQVRIPSIHGPYTQAGYNGQPARNYVRDADLPSYPSLLLPHLPNEGEVCALATMNENAAQFLVIGLTGGSYYTGSTNIGG